MNCIITRKEYIRTCDWYVFGCRYGLCPALAMELAFFFASLLGISFPEPQHLPLKEILHQMFRCNPLCWFIKINRTVGIPIGQYVVKVRIRVSCNARDPQLLYALAVVNLSNSRELKKLPRWMARAIRKQAQHIHVLATKTTFDQVCVIGSPSAFASEQRASKLALRMVKGVEFDSIHRVLIWRGAKAVAMHITCKDFAAYYGKLYDMPPLCVELLNFVTGYSRPVASLATYAFISLEIRHPSFFYTKEGCSLLAIGCFCAGITRISCNAAKEAVRLAGYTRMVAQGRALAGHLFAEAEENEAPVRADLPEGDQLASPEDMQDCAEELPAVDDTENGTEDPGDQAVPLASGIENGTEAAEAVLKAEEEATPAPSVAEQEKDAPVMQEVPGMQEVPCQEEEVSSEEAAKAASVAASEAISEDIAPSYTSTEESVLRETTEEESVLREASTEKSAFRETLAAVYAKMDGKIPGIVADASELDNSQKAGKRRRINRYHGTSPALSIGAMVELFDTMFPGCYITDFKKATRKGENDVLYLHTRNNSGSMVTCPVCGQKHKRVRDANTHTLYDTPLRNGVGLQLELTMARSVCQNPACSNFHKTYTEECSFARGDHLHTTRVQFLALILAASSSFRDAQRQLKLMGVEYGDDLVKKSLSSLEFMDEKDVEVLGMDDVSILKGQTYSTILYNMETGHMLKLIEGRSGKKFQDELHQWLDRHPKVRIICRDRASSYGCYIDRYLLEHPDRKIEQCADRFHIFQNLSNHLHDAYFSSIPSLIALKVEKDDAGKAVKAEILEKVPNRTAVPVSAKSEGLEDLKYDNSEPLDESGNKIVFDVSIDRLPDKAKMKKMDESEALYQKICQIRSDYEAIGSKFERGEKKQFLSEHGISEYMLKKYVGMSAEDLEAMRGSWKPASKKKLFDNYKYIAYKMLKEGRSISDAFWYIRDVAGGWDKGDSTLMDYVRETYRVAFPDRPLPLLEELIEMKYPEGVVVIGRRRLYYALMTYDEKKQDGELAPHLDLICKKYPACESVRAIAKEFHDILIVDSDMGKRTPEKCEKAVENLKAFIEKHSVDGDKLKGFASSLKSDLPCIINAICMVESSGRVEGSNAKMKCVKRISFGKLSHESLEQKLKMSFMYTDDTFTLYDIVPWMMDSLEDPETDSKSTGAAA